MGRVPEVHAVARARGIHRGARVPRSEVRRLAYRPSRVPRGIGARRHGHVQATLASPLHAVRAAVATGDEQ